MPITDRKSLREQIRNGEHLTFVDEVKASFQPVAEKEAYLKEAAQRRKNEYDTEQRRKKNPGPGPSI